MINKLLYEDCLKALKLPSLYYRRKRGDVVIKTNKYLTGKYQERNRWQAHTQQGNIV